MNVEKSTIAEFTEEDIKKIVSQYLLREYEWVNVVQIDKRFESRKEHIQKVICIVKNTKNPLSSDGIGMIKEKYTLYLTYKELQDMVKDYLLEKGYETTSITQEYRTERMKGYFYIQNHYFDKLVFTIKKIEGGIEDEL